MNRSEETRRLAVRQLAVTGFPSSLTAQPPNRLTASLVALCLLPLAFAVRPSASHAAEQPDRVVTLSQALDLLDTQNPDTIAARLQIADAEADRLQARLYQNPTLSVDADNIAVGRTTPSGLSVGQTIGSTVRLDQPLVLWGKRGLRIAGAEAGVAAATQQARDTRRQLRAAVKDAFFQTLHDARLLAFATENQARYQAVIGLNQRRFHGGDISEVELRKIELENLKFATDVEEARRGLGESQQLLGRLIGSAQPVGASGELAVPAVRIDDASLLDTAIDTRPDIAALQRQREQAGLALQLARRERYPDVTVGADYTNSQFATAGDNRNTIGFGFSVPLPVLNQNQGAIAKAEVALRQAENDLARTRLEVAREVHDSLERYRSLQRLRQLFESGYLDRARLALTAAETSQRVGAASLLELLDAERTYTATQTDYLDTLLAMRASLDTLEKAVGKDLTPE
jgi:cobalt-zinc-cadmium efflux system outer membrane protein